MPKVQATKEKTDTLDIIKIKNLCASKDILSRKRKDNPQNGRKYLEVIYLVKGLVYRIYKESLQPNSEKTTQF